MAFDGEVMTLQTQAVQQAAIIRRDIRSIERRIAWGIVKAEQEGAADVLAALNLSKACALSLHRSLEVVAEQVGAHYGETPTIYSGGDDKPADPPPEGP